VLTLTIMRHGRAESNPGSDFDRRLAPLGVRRSRLVAEQLQQAGVSWDRVVTSPAVRASQTAAAVLEVVPSGRRPQEDRDLYDSTTPEALMSALKRHAAGGRSVALFGHNPGLSWLARWLCPDVGENLDTSDAVVLELDQSDWDDVAPASAKLRFRSRPDDRP